ncbi:AP-5 complex subunit sigma-1 [Plasmodium brasilianum]|uniref:AP-5 complex subunit sigma-1 n=1 Tax=Plasmodium brasilianum TaxID=5824 RepID=A0ACB9YA74_PLABR|nr:AP-5 complex subunit sigma-1 [Plasmodium brasilianum]
MVYGIIIHSAECHEKLYFSSYYSIESNDKNQYTIMKRVIEEIKYYEESKEIFENTTKNNKEKYFDLIGKFLSKICYTLVLFTHENIHLNLFNPDTVLAILYFFLPKGQLMLINQNYTKFLNNEVNKFLEEQAKVKTKDYKIE